MKAERVVNSGAEEPPLMRKGKMKLLKMKTKKSDHQCRFKANLKNETSDHQRIF